MSMASHYSLNIAHFAEETQFGPRFTHFAKVDCGPDREAAKAKLAFFGNLYALEGTRAKLTLTYWHCEGQTLADWEVGA